ncbi:phosphate ABC transporter substrate-binding protein PstS [Salinactinospora qingdaonensis]|uniref:Phosphate ABC transporter substrate-binding protein PstS n=2 Tax=Salinactinospora qingdaonensis TaxID=702744 RepID=A0ABP7FK95_9ACTN
MQVWMAGYMTVCSDTQVFYDVIGSGGGRSKFLDGAVEFAGSDAPLEGTEQQWAQERCNGAPAIHLPSYVVPIAVIFRLRGVDSVNLSPHTLAHVFAGEISHWDDPAITADNPDLDLPHQRITPVNRSDESGTTENFTTYLSQAAGQAWPHEPSGQWPVQPVEAAQGNSGIAEAVEGGEGTIGYVEASHVGELSTARIGVGETFVEVSAESAAKILNSSPEREGGSEYDHAVNVDYRTDDPDIYPIVLISYEIACLSYEKPVDARGVKAFLSYILSAEGQQAAAEEAGSAPLSAEILAKLAPAVRAIDSNGE